MNKSSLVSLSAVALWLLTALSLAAPGDQAQQEKAYDHEAMGMEGNGSSPSGEPQHHHEMGMDSEVGTASAGHQHHMAGLTMPEGHHHRPPVLPPAEDQAYSELNHHIAGVFVLCAGGLALLKGGRALWRGDFPHAQESFAQEGTRHRRGRRRRLCA